jgi:hypothetical protein
MFRIRTDLSQSPMLETVLVNFTDSQMRRDWVGIPSGRFVQLFEASEILID